MVSRIKQLLEWQQLSPTQFADRIGVGRPVVSHILSERNKPSLEVARSIKAAFPELSLDWLLNGSGEMLTGAPPVPPQPPAAAASPVMVADPGAPQAAVAPVAAPAARLSNAAGQAEPARKQQAYQAPAAGLAAPGRFTAARTAAPVSPPARVAARRFVAANARATPSQEPPLPAAASNSTPSPDPFSNAGPDGLADQKTEQAAVPAAPYAPAVPAPAETGGLAQALAAGMSEPGKAIRRIVIFYSDGSFADYKPETQA